MVIVFERETWGRGEIKSPGVVLGMDFTTTHHESLSDTLWRFWDLDLDVYIFPRCMGYGFLVHVHNTKPKI